MRKREKLDDPMSPPLPVSNPEMLDGSYIKYIEKDPALRYKFNAKPGQVRNPWGRRGKPLSKTHRERIRTYMENREFQEACKAEAEENLRVLREIRDKPESADAAKLQAIAQMTDRAYGKATQNNVNTQVNADGKPAEVDARTLDERIEQAINRLEAVTDGKGQEAPSPERSADLRKLN